MRRTWRLGLKVTVGIPAYNNEATLAATIESVLAQSFKDFELIISDDCSIDDTWKICRKYSEIDDRIKIIRQTKNLYYLNFLFLIHKSSARYFVWLAGDDLWSPNYLSSCLLVLDQRPDVVGCTSRCQFTSHGRLVSISDGGAASLQGSWEQNVGAYLRRPYNPDRLYAVFRIGALDAAFPRKIMHAYDWALCAATLKYGKHIVLDEILLTRDKTPWENYAQSVKRDHTFFVYRLFPVLCMSLHLVFHRKIPLTWEVSRALIALNYKKHEQYMKLIHPKTFSLIGWAYRLFRKHIAWRI